MAGGTLTPPWWQEQRRPGTGRVPSRWLDPELAAGIADDAPHGEWDAQLNGRGPLGDGEQPPAFRERRIYPMGINRNHLEQAIRELGLPAIITRDEHDADAVLVLKTLYRRQSDRVNAFQQTGVPVYVLRSAGVDRLREALADLYRADIERVQSADEPRTPAGDEAPASPR